MIGKTTGYYEKQGFDFIACSNHTDRLCFHALVNDDFNVSQKVSFDTEKIQAANC